MSRAAPRRRAERSRRRDRAPRPEQGRRGSRPAATDPPRPTPAPDPPAPETPATVPAPPAAAAQESAPARSARLRTTVGETRLPVLAWAAVVLAGLGCLVAAAVPVGPPMLGPGGAVAVAAAYSWALAARTGGRPLFFGGLAIAVGVVVLVVDEPWLRTGAAVLTCVVAAVLGVMVTVPAVRFVAAARECGYAVLVAAAGAVATAGFEPEIDLLRFEYLTLALAFLCGAAVVYRLGAGLHGLGRRGVVTVLLGCVVLALVLAYAELLRRYGTPGLVESLLDGVRWSRANLGAFPRPIETVLGVPALVWGCHMRARRRQGWWVCAFGVAATTPVASSLMNPAIGLLEVLLSVVYGLVIGLVIGYLVIRIDLALTGPRGSRARRAEEASAGRPEPGRTRPLL